MEDNRKVMLRSITVMNCSNNKRLTYRFNCLLKLFFLLLLFSLKIDYTCLSKVHLAFAKSAVPEVPSLEI